MLKRFSENFLQLIIPFSALEEGGEELIKRLSYPHYLLTYLFLRRYVCRDERNPVAGHYYAEGKLVSYVSRKKIAETLGLNPTRISQILAKMQEWGDIAELEYTGREKIWELGRIEEIETPEGTVEMEVFYFDLHIAKGEKKEVIYGKG